MISATVTELYLLRSMTSPPLAEINWRGDTIAAISPDARYYLIGKNRPMLTFDAYGVFPSLRLHLYSMIGSLTGKTRALTEGDDFRGLIGRVIQETLDQMDREMIERLWSA